LFGTLLGLGGGFLALRWLVHTFTTETAPDFGVTTQISATSVLMTLVLGVLAVGTAPLLTSRRLRRMDVPAALRVLE
jgi:putative ABC transport system permease protein